MTKHLPSAESSRGPHDRTVIGLIEASLQPRSYQWLCKGQQSGSGGQSAHLGLRGRCSKSSLWVMLISLLRYHVPVYTIWLPGELVLVKNTSVTGHDPVFRGVLRKNPGKLKNVLEYSLYLVLSFLHLSWFPDIILLISFLYFNAFLEAIFGVGGYIFEEKGKEEGNTGDWWLCTAEIWKQCAILDFRQYLLHFSKEPLLWQVYPIQKNTFASRSSSFIL